MSLQILERDSKETARDYAFRTLRYNIVTLTLVPGSMLSENEIASELGLSRTPVREALIDLSRALIVDIIPQCGSRISLIDYKLVEESCFLRRVLENAIVDYAASIASTLDFSKLEENLHLQSFYLENPKDNMLLKLDNEFHELLFSVCDKSVCYDWLKKGLTVHFDRVRSMSLMTVKDIKIVEDHKAILSAIKAGNSQEAVNLMTKHLSRYKIDEVAIRAQYPGYFKD
ncbi:MAG: GntR family transcriptional regulator [Sphaerochaetaceae bacterium]|jgi:DNA-binding GntR family transcriptional regulator